MPDQTPDTADKPKEVRHNPADRLATFLTFIEAVENGDSLKEACIRAGVAWGSVSRWIADPANIAEGGETYAARYARARLNSAAGFAERALDVAMTAKDAQLGRLQVDTLKWRAAMADPKGYSERRQVDSTVTHRLLPPSERDAALGRIIARANLIPPNVLASGDDVLHEVIGDCVEDGDTGDGGDPGVLGHPTPLGPE